MRAMHNHIRVDAASGKLVHESAQHRFAAVSLGGMQDGLSGRLTGHVVVHV
jgi:hypothetical protein